MEQRNAGSLLPMSSACSGWDSVAMLERMSQCFVSPQLREAGG